MSDEFDDEPVAAARPLGAAAPDRAGGRTRVPVARLISRLYAAANAPLRARMLSGLLRPLGPLGLVAIASGAFAGFLQRQHPGTTRIALEEVGRHTNEQIFELANFVEQVSPEAVQQVASLVYDNPAGIAAFSVSVALLIVRALQGRPGSRQ